MSVKYLSLLLLLNFNCSGMWSTIPPTTEERLDKLMRDNADMQATLARMEAQQHRIESQVNSINMKMIFMPLTITTSVLCALHYYNYKK